jgi:hypothetical protein
MPIRETPFTGSATGRSLNEYKQGKGRIVKELRHAAAATAAGLSMALAAGTASSAPITFNQTYYAQHGPEDDFAARAGWEAANQASPSAFVAAIQRVTAARAFDGIAALGFDSSQSWKAIGPTVGNVPGPVTYTGAPSVASGRVTSLAVSNQCEPSYCVALVGAAGGGVWKTTNALAGTPDWRPVSAGLPTNSIGSLFFDPTDDEGLTVYVGTGEPNGSSDSEAGAGLYKSVDGGEHWSVVPGSFDVAHDRAIAAIAVDPRNSRHLWIGTALARHGSSAVNGGRFTPPDAPTIGLYESIDGGLSFTLAFSLPGDSVVPSSPNGSDFFRGGVSKIATYRQPGKNAFTQIYFSVFDYGLYRSTADHLFEQVFAGAGGGAVATSLAARTEFALAPIGQKLRIYLGDVGAAPADFYRTDNANVSAATLLTGGSNGGWMKLSNPTPGTAGFSSYDFCQGQCSYDMFVATPPGRPDTVWLGGSMQYGELFKSSNGRAVVRSTNAGVSFTDMTNDALPGPAPDGMHPDQHAIAFLPGYGDAALIGSDGGVVRTSGAYANASADCSGRNLTGAHLADCQNWLAVIPTRITFVNAGLNTLQFQGVAVNAQDPYNDIIGGTQDNGTWAYDKAQHSWFESVGGDGGPPAISPVTGIRIHLYYSPAPDVNFNGNDVLSWDWIGDPLQASGEAASFYVPLIADPQLAGTFFVGLQHVWRTTDNGGPQADLDQHCNEYFGDFTITCGDWVPLGGDLTGRAYGGDKTGSYVVNISRASNNDGPLWVGTRRGRLFVSSNASAPDPKTVTYTRIDTPAQPTRFISGIAVDAHNPLHAFVSFSGYDAYTPTTTGHVFEVTYDPNTGTAQWRNLSSGLGDQPILSIAYDADARRLYAATDFGVLVRTREGAWMQAAGGLPPVAVYQLVLDQGSHLLYAATHGRGIYRLERSED